MSTELIYGDCLEIMKNMESGSVDMVLTDLPYGTTKCRWDSIIPLGELWRQYNRLLKPDGVCVLFAVRPFTTTLIASNIKNFRHTWYWIKNTAVGFAYAKYQPMRNVEDICVFYKKAGAYRPQGLKPIENARPKRRKPTERDDYVYEERTLAKEYTPKYTNYPKQCLYFKNETGLHPTQKPVPLLEYLIRSYMAEGGTVLDSCMGSGSTGIACINTGRNFIGIERDSAYFELAKDRINGWEAQKEH